MTPKIESNHAPRAAPGDVAPAAPAMAPPPPSRQSLLARARRAMGEEVHHLNLRLVLASACVGLLPDGTFGRLRASIYRAAGLRIGAHTIIFGRMRFTGARYLQDNLRVGAHVFINAHFFADVNAPVTIGDWVAIGHHVTLITAEHELGPAYCRAGTMRPAAIEIGDGAWIGAGAKILSGVTLGKSSVVAAGALVASRVPDNRMVGGVPARPLKSLPATP
jgi:acetyltransferase-like isoleucine patch superfamily enzyme